MCKLAQQASAMCVEREGAMESIPALAEVQMRVEPAFSDDEDE
jgi:sugar/nucleoside kinase (ribokinase family)